MGIETLIISILVGGWGDSLLIGIIAFVITGILYMIPVIGQALGMICSILEAALVYQLLLYLGWLSKVESYYLAIAVFFVFSYLHNVYVGMEDLRCIGFGWLIFECIVICGSIYYSTNSVILCSIIGIVCLVMSVIPYIRVFDFFVLSLGAGYLAYGSSIPSVGDGKHAITIGIIFLLFSVVMYIYVYKSLDYIGMKKNKEEREARNNHLMEYYSIRANIYKKYSELEKEYYYFRTSVCVNEQERDEFDSDWEKYIFHLNNNSYLTFNNFFENKKLYIYRFYNRDYANNCRSNKNHDSNHSSEKNEEQQSFREEGKIIIYFKGISSMDGLKSRYRELMKIYHTDNPNGDTGVCQIIQEEYQYLLNLYNKKSAP